MALTVNSGMDMTALFSSLSGGKNPGSFSVSGASILSDYASIKNGSYGKLVKSYYAKKNSRVEAEDKSEKQTNAAVDKKVAANATSLAAASSALSDSKSLYMKKDIKDQDGNVKHDYDWDQISRKVSDFVSAYNDTVKKAAASDTNGVLSSTLNMVKSTAANSSMLSSVGITIKDDNTLSLDTDKLKKADMSDIKSVFSGVGSYGYNVGSSAQTIASRANNVSSLYGSDLKYSAAASVSGIMDAYF